MKDERTKHIISALCSTLLVCLAAGPARGQSDLRVFRATLVAGASVEGKLALLPSTLLFLDDAQPQSSFAVGREGIASLGADAESVTVQLRDAIQDRAGRSTRLILRFEGPSDAAAVERWWGGAAELSASPESADELETLTFSAQRNKTLRGNTDGKLIVDSTRVVFESTDKAEDSRRWRLGEIRELKLKNPYKVEIRTFRGEKYTLNLSGRGMDNDQFREIQRRVIEARTAR